jgi:hypothetical protein
MSEETQTQFYVTTITKHISIWFLLVAMSLQDHLKPVPLRSV